MPVCRRGKQQVLHCRPEYWRGSFAGITRSSSPQLRGEPGPSSPSPTPAPVLPSGLHRKVLASNSGSPAASSASCAPPSLAFPRLVEDLLHPPGAKPDRLGHAATGQPDFARLDDRNISPSPGFIESSRNSPQLLVVPRHVQAPYRVGPSKRFKRSTKLARASSRVCPSAPSRATSSEPFQKRRYPRVSSFRLSPRLQNPASHLPSGRRSIRSSIPFCLGRLRRRVSRSSVIRGHRVSFTGLWLPATSCRGVTNGPQRQFKLGTASGSRTRSRCAAIAATRRSFPGI
jgi:hypothetical protein